MPRTRARLLLRVGIVLLIVVGLSRGWLAWPQSLLVRSATPLVRSVADVGQALRGVGESFLRVGRLSRAVRILEEENARLRALATRVESVERENARLREDLRLRPRGALPGVTADVVSYSTEGTASVLLINRGSHDGVRVGAPVIVYEGILVGRVRAVFPLSATVSLLADPSVRASAETVGSSAEGLVRGVKGLEVVFDTVPRTATLSPGDRVVTTGLDGVFPPNLLIGTIAAVEAPTTEIYQAARITPALPERRLRVVYVLSEE